MKELRALSPPLGGAAEVTLTSADAKLNVDEYSSLEKRRHRTGFPKPTGQSQSYWLQQVRCDPLLDHRTTEKLPTEADTVVIGSGVCFSI
jgi:hypothetical protein